MALFLLTFGVYLSKNGQASPPTNENQIKRSKNTENGDDLQNKYIYSRWIPVDVDGR